MPEAKSTRPSKGFILSQSRKDEASFETVNWPAFDYYRCLRRLQQGLESDPRHPLSLKTAARVACLEPKYFSSFFHKKVGVSFVTWRNSLRVNKVIEMISKVDQSMADVAHAAGFNDVRTFERAFKRHTGITAAQFKKSVASSRWTYRKAKIRKFAGKITKNAAQSR